MHISSIVEYRPSYYDNQNKYAVLVSSQCNFFNFYYNCYVISSKKCHST